MKPSAKQAAYKITGILKFKGVEFLSSMNAIAKDTAKRVESNAEKSKTIRENLKKVTDIQGKIDASKSTQKEIIERQEKFLKNTSTSPKATENAFSNIFKAVVKKPIETLQKLLLGALIALAPQIISAVKKLINQFKLLKTQIGKFIETGTNLFSNSINIVQAIITNALSFDFTDKSQRLENAIKEYEKDFKKDREDLEEISKMWGLGEEELSRAITLMEQGKDPRTARELSVQPTETITGQQATPNSSSGANVNGTGEEYRIAAAVATEAGRGVSATDVLQVAANRVADPAYPNSFTDVFAEPGQFQGVFDRGIGRYREIKTAEDAAAFSGRSVEQINGYVADLRNNDFRADSASTIGGALEFRAAPQYYQERPSARPAGTGSDGRIPGSSWRGGRGDNQILTDPSRGDPMRAGGAAPITYNQGTTSSQQPTPTNSNGGTVTATGNTTNTAALRQGDSVSGFRVSSAYGPRWGSTHKGVDVATPVGTYVAFTVPVEVVATGTYGAYGYLVDVWAPSLGIQFRLAHLSKILVGKGQKIGPGMPIARTGGAKGHPGSGRSTGPHLHFEVDNQKDSVRGGGSNDPAMIAKYAKFIILSSKAPSAKIAGKLGGINNINSLTRIDEKMSALNYDYEQAEQTMNTQIVMVTQPVLATRTMVVNKVKKVGNNKPVAISGGKGTAMGYNDRLMNNLA